MEKISKLFHRILEFAPFDAAADQMGIEFIHSSLPPYLTESLSDNFFLISLIHFFIFRGKR